MSYNSSKKTTVTFSENEKMEHLFHEGTNTPLHCKKCQKGFIHSKYLLQHEEKCKGVDMLTCPRCMQSFSTRQHKNRHIKADRCIARSIIYARKPQHTNGNHNLQVTEASRASQVQNINTQNINTQNNTQIQSQNNTNCNQIENQVIYINNYGSERIDHLNCAKYLEMFQKNYDIPSMMTKEIHFNIDFPENHNIQYNNEKTALVKSGDEYIYKDLNTLVEELIRDKSRMIQAFAVTNKDTICNSISSEIYEEIIDLLLKLVLIKEPSSQYKRQVSIIMNMIRNTKKPLV